MKNKVKVKVNESKWTIVCNNLCGNILLSDQVPDLEVWRERMSIDVALTTSVFNSALSTASILVRIVRKEGSPVEFSIPPGNTLSATVDDAQSIIVFKEGIGGIEGKFSLEVCFPVFHDVKCNHKNKKES
ncbi:S-Ena type endospore appendage [Peribacillus muralis]|uniref:S-Ena type endospore appendage n=1 Tax=Peribacillus muralis TaxID=264697 RepID=UPI00366B5913